MKYYIKQFGANELGSIGRDRVCHRGRFLFTSKDERVLQLFPPLSTTVKNDFSHIALTPLYLPEAKRIYCHFAYHNDVFHEGTRNEYRLYSNRELEGGTVRFKVGDCLLMRKVSEDDVNPGFYVDHITPKDKDLYWFCRAAVKASSIRGAYAIWEGEIAKFEEKVKVLSCLDLANAVAIDEKVIDAAKTASADKMERLFTSQGMFRDFLLVEYNRKCAVTRTSIEYGNFYNLEAAHLRPKSQGGSFVPSNGIMLTRDLHWAFDKGFFTLTDNLTVKVHPKVRSESLHALSGRKIYTPTDEIFCPKKENIRWHQKKIYGLFLTTGMIQGA